MGWQPTYDHWGLFMWKNPASLAETIGLKPLSGRFRIRVLAATDADIHDIESRSTSAVAGFGIEPIWQLAAVNRKTKDGVLEKIDVLDGWGDIVAVLGPDSDGEAIIRRLDGIVRSLSESLRRK